VGEVVALGTQLRQRREELGLSQAQAARQLDVARTAYRLWEMEAARPAPDRWRAIAKWLGISMTAMLLAAELLEDEEAANSERFVVGGGMTRQQWDTRSATIEGDYFSQERAMIEDQTRSGHLSAYEAEELRRVLSRIQRATSGDRSAPWQPGRFRKRFPCAELTPALSRSALATTAVGIPDTVFEDAALLISELVTNSVRHSESEWVDVAITLGPEVLRIEVSDQGTQPIRPQTPNGHGGWGLGLVGELATRWGVERESTGKTIWIEFDLRPFI
jgi:anti-sigma regulatory factor (Ser/Thr protein kinase)/transcriptional regulator with XRE-family HTH domain